MNSIHTFNSRKCNICIQQGIFNSSKVKQCTKCKLIFYCGVEHQKVDYKRHRPFCNTIYGLVFDEYIFDKGESLKGSSNQVFLDKKIILGAYCTARLGRDLTMAERYVRCFQ